MLLEMFQLSSITRTEHYREAFERLRLWLQDASTDTLRSKFKILHLLWHNINALLRLAAPPSVDFLEDTGIYRHLAHHLSSMKP